MFRREQEIALIALVEAPGGAGLLGPGRCERRGSELAALADDRPARHAILRRSS
jgi:hypothetical protein